MTKKSVLFGSIVAMIFSGIFIFSREIGICPPHSYGACIEKFDSIAITFFPFFLLFLFSLITYRMQEEIFQKWWKFACIATPVSMLFIVLAPAYSHDWMFPIEKGSVFLMTSVIFVFVSGIIIVRAHRKAK
ncbi:MAG: hypothetical protein PHT88_01495 [Candidatus Moranbacteria bacterium]|nr:hypothetical protein [Candidatus Moranbacteria bacterium]